VYRTAGAVPRRALLVDDVTTTGATLDAAARVLLDGGAERVYALAVARED
jgi:predicted amidophosphoribosyltransferase